LRQPQPDTLEIPAPVAGCTNVVERSFDVRSDDWKEVGVFMGGTVPTNWSEIVSDTCHNVFYRLISR
jgi:hypothetical protein